jgi:hypothetical protein
MPRVGYEPTTAVFKRAKTVHALDRAATVTGTYRKFFLLISNEHVTVNGECHNQMGTPNWGAVYHHPTLSKDRQNYSFVYSNFYVLR